MTVDAGLQVQAVMDRVLKKWRLRCASYEVLQALAGHSRLKTQQIANGMVGARPDITRIIDRLASLEYVRRTREEKPDRRAVWIELTPYGLEVYQAATIALEKEFEVARNCVVSKFVKQVTRELEGA